MANLEHADLTDPNIHEPKGASDADADTIYVANGAGSGTWTTIEDVITGGTVSAFGSFMHVYTTASGSLVEGVATQINITAVGSNTIVGASVGSNRITLPAGSYAVISKVSATPNMAVRNVYTSDSPVSLPGPNSSATTTAMYIVQKTHQVYTRLYNITDSTAVITGPSCLADPMIIGEFTLAGSKVLALQGTATEDDYLITYNGVEHPASIFIWKIA